MYTIIGLGNPGEKYENSRHNSGRAVLAYFSKKQGFEPWKEDTRIKSLLSSGKIKKHKVLLLLPETFRNKSGDVLKQLMAKSYKLKAETLIVIYDDLDLPLGTFKISFGRGSGGHKGLESVIRSIKTKDFVRVRVGMTPATPGGKLKKPKGEKKVLDFILGDFTKREREIFKKVSKKINDALVAIIIEGRAAAMNSFN